MKKIIFLTLLLFPLVGYSTDVNFKKKLERLPKEVVLNGISFKAAEEINDFEKDSTGSGYSVFYYENDCSISFYVYNANPYQFEETDDGLVTLKEDQNGKAKIDLENIPLEARHAYRDISLFNPDLEPKPIDFATAFAYTKLFHDIKLDYQNKKEELLKEPPVFSLIGKTFMNDGKTQKTIEAVGITTYQNNFIKIRMTCHRNHSKENIEQTINEGAAWLIKGLSVKQDE